MFNRQLGPKGPHQEMGLRQVDAQSAAPDHAQTASGLVPGDDSGHSDRGQSPVPDAAIVSRAVYGSARIREALPALETILATSDEVADSGVRVRTVVLGGGDSGARRRWINGQIFGPPTRSALPSEPDDDADPYDDAGTDYDATGGVRVPAIVPTPSGVTGARALPER